MKSKFLGGATLFSLLAFSAPSWVSASGEKILVFRDSLSYNGHTAAINAAMTKLKGWQAANGFTIDTTTTFTSFTTANLAKYDAVVLMYPEHATKAAPGTGISDTMTAEQDSAFKSWVLTGKGYVGVHCDTRQNPDWPWWYKTFVGSTYVGDVGPVTSNFIVADPNEIMTQGMPATFSGNEQLRVDSLYFTEADTSFKVLVRGDINDYVKNNTTANPVLKPWANNTTVVSWMPFFPFVYRHNYQGARMFHLAPGHNATTWTSGTSNWNNLMLNGILYAINRPGYGGTPVLSKGLAAYGFSLNAQDHSLRFGVPKKGRVVIEIFNLKGRLISKLADRTYNAGTYTLPLPLPAGSPGSVSIVDFRAGNVHKSMKIVL